MRKLLLLLILAVFPVLAQPPTSNATALRGKKLCNPLSPSDTDALVWSSSSNCWGPGSGGGGGGVGAVSVCSPAGASATAYTCTASPSVSALSGLEVLFTPDVSCGANPTLNVTSLGAKSLKLADGSTAATCTAGIAQVYLYNGTSFILVSPGLLDKIEVCEIPIGLPGAASPVLADDNDAIVSCANKSGITRTIIAVECYANEGSPTVTPIITGGGGTSILSGALTCGTASFAAGTLNGTPTQSNNGTIDGNITTAGGVAKFIQIRVTTRRP